MVNAARTKLCQPCLRLFNHLHDTRLAPSALEPRAAIGQWDDATQRYTLTASTQGVAVVRRLLAEGVFKIPPQQLRVVTPDVGGGFGMKGDVYPEDALVLWSSRKLGRPVKWVATRTESMLGDNHGRDQLISADMALDDNGRILAIRAQALHAVGACVTNAGVVPVLCSLRNIPGVYVVPATTLTVPPGSKRSSMRSLKTPESSR